MSWYGKDAGWTKQRQDLLAWILRQPQPGAYAAALLRMQRDKTSYAVDLPKMVADLETRVINEALEVTAGNIKAAADLIGFRRTTLSARLRSLPARRRGRG